MCEICRKAKAVTTRRWNGVFVRCCRGCKLANDGT